MTNRTDTKTPWPVGKALPCPICGSEVVYDPLDFDAGHFMCDQCGYCSPNETKENVVAAHNRVARAAAKEVNK